MKRTRYISLIIAMLSVLGLTAQQQQSQYALYNYRNDGDFNAWLNIDVDSITYSNIGLDSVEYDNIVTQEVWTPDSCYRIPIEVIDSIGFRAPKPEYQDDVFHITIEHIPYITAVDSLTITFYSTLPVMMRPVVGQVVTSDTFEEPLTEGFAGKVLEINDDGEHVTIICEGANVTDVFKRLVLVGKGVGVNEEEAKSRPLRKPRKIWGDYEDYDNIEFEFPGKVSVKINDFLSIEDEVSMAADYYVYVDLPRFKMRATATGTHNLKTSWSIDSDKILEWMGLERDKFEPDWATPFWPVVAIPGVFSFGVKLGGFLDPSVKLSLTGSTPITFTHTFGVEFSNTDTHVMFPMVIPIANVHSELGTPEISLSLEGKLFAGIALGLKTKLIADNVVHGDITGRFGPEFDAKIQMKQTLGEGDPISWYSLLKDSKVGVQIKADAKVKAKVFGKNMTENLAWDWKWPIPGWELTRYLFPDFTKPELPHYLMPEPLDMTTTPHKDIIMPIYAGLGIYDEEGTQQRAYYSAELYRTDAYYKRIPHIYIGDLPAGQKFTCRPIFNIPSLPGIGEIKADPVTEFTVPEPMTLNLDTPLNSVTLKKGQEQYVAINGGWGDYSAISSIEGLCSAEIIKNNDQPYVKISASKQMEGSAVVTVKDLRAGTTETILITVSGEFTPVTRIVLAPNELTMEYGESKTLLATVLPLSADNKDVLWSSSDSEVAVVSGEGRNATVTAVGGGSCTITCSATDGSGVYAECPVTVPSSGNVDEGLVAYYPFNGNANDESGNGNHGSVIGNVELVSDRFGNSNSAYRFPGEAFNYISVPDNETLHCSTFTLNAWVYTDADDYGSGYLICKGRDIINGSYRLCVRNVGAQNLYNGNNDAFIEEMPQVGVWHMVTGTVEGDQAKFYLDGILMDERTLSYPFTYGNSDPMALGMHYYSGVPSYWAYPLLGILDDVRIYNRVLDASEIKSLYREQ